MNFKRNLKAQAILELAIFGSLIIMLLGVLLNYGLRYYAQQQAIQEAFRYALASAVRAQFAGQPVSVSHTVVKDINIPDTTNPFSPGTLTPVFASASVTRDYRLHETPDTTEELPETKININGQIIPFKNAGIRKDTIEFKEEKELEEKKESVDKYKEIYGSGNVWTKQTCYKCYSYDSDYGGEYDAVDGTCYPTDSCVSGKFEINIIDPMEGELPNYETGLGICRQIVDKNVCIQSCEAGKAADSDKDCAKICNLSIPAPWYCGSDYVQIDSEHHRYRFPFLEKLFAIPEDAPENKPRPMGLQTDYIQQVNVENRQTRKETPRQAGQEEAAPVIKTVDYIDWEVQLKRMLVYKPMGKLSDPEDLFKKEVITEVTKKEILEWKNE